MWTLRDESGIQAMRVEVGRGSVTVINATPFRERSLFDGDHGWLFVAATEMRRGDDVHFISEDDHPSLLALLWQYGAPVVMLTLTLVALVLWRGGVRFGPLAAAPDAARRSLVEQIRGTGQFALAPRRRELASRGLRARARRSGASPGADLRELVRRRTRRSSGASHRPRPGRSGGGGSTRGGRRSHELRNTIALLEAARRRTLIAHTRFSHGTD